jgi:putative ABC transport system permease protein
MIELRTEMEAAAGAAAIGRQVQALGGDLPVVSVETQADAAAGSVGTERLMSELAAASSVLAVVLASIGLYGVLAFDVARRAREIAIRLAIGAQAGDLVRLVLARGARLVLPGTAVGIAGALVVPRLLHSLLFGLGVVDPLTFIGAPLVLLLVALVACYIPARRAMKGDPLLALRSD